MKRRRCYLCERPVPMEWHLDADNCPVFNEQVPVCVECRIKAATEQEARP